MIRKITIGVLNLIILYLPPKKRQQKRIGWLQGLLYPYYTNELAFYTWRDDMIVRATVTGETGILQWYLNYKFDAALQRILIVDAVDDGIYVPYDDSEDTPVLMGLDIADEPDGDYTIALTSGESSSDLPVDFRVMVPTAVDVNQVTAIVRLYNMAHKSFDVQTF